MLLQDNALSFWRKRFKEIGTISLSLTTYEFVMIKMKSKTYTRLMRRKKKKKRMIIIIIIIFGL